MVYYLTLANYIERMVMVKGLKGVCWCHSQKLNKNNKYYAVTEGRTPGIYTSSYEYTKQVYGYSNANSKTFTNREDALLYMKKELDVLKEMYSHSKKTSINNLENILSQYKDLWKEEYAKAEESWKFTVKSLTFDSEGYLEVYTDGACHNHGRSDAVASIGVYFGDGSELNTSAIIDGEVTNNIAEIRAAIMGLRKSRQAGYKKVKILTDSIYVVVCLERWINYRKNNWKKMKSDSVLSKEDLVELDQILSTMDVKWAHVYSGRNVKGNDRADQLAQNCIQKWKEEMKEK